MLDIYPWQKNEWQHLVSRKNSDNLPHALLFIGAEGLGKEQLAKRLAALLLCKNPATFSDAPCGSCTSCHLLLADNHPDLHMINPETKEKAIKIDQIRDLTVTFSQTAQQGGYKIAIISPAENMNIAASNALLKTLEEPLGHALIILVSENIAALPATIRSRCQQVVFHAPDSVSAQRWLLQNVSGTMTTAIAETLLSLAGNAPLKALEFFNENVLQMRENFFDGILALTQQKIDVITFADINAEINIKHLLLFFNNIVSDLLKYRVNVDANYLCNRDKLPLIQQLTNHTKPFSLLSFVDYLTELNKFLQVNINLNKQLLLEGLAYSWLNSLNI